MKYYPLIDPFLTLRFSPGIYYSFVIYLNHLLTHIDIRIIPYDLSKTIFLQYFLLYVEFIIIKNNILTMSLNLR